MTSKIKYLGDLRTEAQHLSSGVKLITDAPVDNFGKGEAFSPTDLLATSLGSCMLTIVGIVANRENIDVKGTEVEILKLMGTEPRRVIGINAKVIFKTNIKLDARQQKLLENAALTCPVAKSLHPDLKQEISFEFTQ